MFILAQEEYKIKRNKDLHQKLYFMCKTHNEPLVNKSNKTKYNSSEEFNPKYDLLKCKLCPKNSNKYYCRHCGELCVYEKNSKKSNIIHDNEFCKLIKKEHIDSHKKLNKCCLCKNCGQINVLIEKKISCCYCGKSIKLKR